MSPRPATTAAPSQASHAAPAAEATETTIAASLAANGSVRRSIEAIVREVTVARESITGARGPLADLAAGYEDALERLAAAKGKPALYPYVGSGLGNGPLVELADGSVKWDMISGIGVHAFGHSDPELIATALSAAMSDTVMQGNLQFNADSIEFAELVLAEAGRTSRLRHAFLCNSGVIANESGLKVCYQKNAPASRVLAFADCFMGRTTTMAQIGDSAAGRVGIPLNTPVDYLPFHDPEQGERSTQQTLAQLQQYLDRYPGQHACMVFELVQGEGGFNAGPREFFEPLMKACREGGIAVFVDEVQTFGRTEAMFHFEQLGLGEYVDVVTLGKMSQICACLYTEAFNPKPGLLSGTFVGSTVALQVGRRVLERLRDGGFYGGSGRNALLQHAFREHAQKLISAHPQWFPPVRHPAGSVRERTPLFGGVGGMMRLTPFGGNKAKITRALHILFAEGVIAFYCGHGPYHIRFLPPIGAMQPEQFGEVFAILERALGAAAREE